ncbi:uncharacterized protein LOC114303777 [Camellia sinensis]|uniref:uncharacterized protein LOC114303777 n=1 Tax=Camellia sinensis TaxID=4442 RepID=UPI001035CD8F|nr:uncharacterized protein LOC114303777 [Camellia sinensis]
MVVKHVTYQQGSSFRILLRKFMVVKHVTYQQGSSFRILLRKLFIVIVAYEARVYNRIRINSSSSTSKTPLKCLLGDKIVLENPGLSTPSLSMSNHSSIDPAKSTRNFKPSGLRMPSPKIGFFDEDAEKNGKSKSPKILGRMNMASAGQKKKISLGADHVKMGNKVATLGSGKDFILSKKSGLGNSCSTSSTTSLESSSSVSVTTSSASSLKSSSNSRRKADSRKSSLAASGSTSKTPLRCSLGDKIVLENPGLSTPSLSMSNHSSIDPAKSTRNFKPSGLRMPSPKIGFFDEHLDAEKNGEANSFPHKSPKILSRMNMASAGQRKKISLGVDHVKMGNKVATLGSGKNNHII